MEAEVRKRKEKWKQAKIARGAWDSCVGRELDVEKKSNDVDLSCIPQTHCDCQWMGGPPLSAA